MRDISGAPRLPIRQQRLYPTGRRGDASDETEEDFLECKPSRESNSGGDIIRHNSTPDGQKLRKTSADSRKGMAGPVGFEPTTLGFPRSLEA